MSSMFEIVLSLISGLIGALVAVAVSLFFSNRFQRKMVRIGEVRHELEEARAGSISSIDAFSVSL